MKFRSSLGAFARLRKATKLRHVSITSNNVQTQLALLISLLILGYMFRFTTESSGPL